LKENGKLVIDSNAYIAYGAGNTSVVNIIEGAEILFLPAPVFGELLYGAKNSNKPGENEQVLNDFLVQSVFVPVDESIASRYATVRTQLKKSGNPIPENDIRIAASSLELNAPILTDDEHFSHVSGLEVINWTNKTD